MNEFDNLDIEVYGTIILEGAICLPWKSFLYTVFPSKGKLVAIVWYEGFKEVVEFFPPQFRKKHLFWVSKNLGT